MVSVFVRSYGGSIGEIFKRTLSDPPGTAPYRVHVDGEFWCICESYNQAVEELDYFFSGLRDLLNGNLERG